jgi:hypothetical protein
MNYKLIFIFLFQFYIFPIFESLYLSYNQWNSIQSIIQNKKTSFGIRNSVNKILFCAYEKFAINQAYSFKKFHKQKCFNINIEDLILSSKFGLFKSIKNYKGTTNFENYSKKYIQGELYKCLTDYHEINNIPKSIRKKKKSSLSFLERRKYNKGLKTSFVSNNDFWRFDKIQIKKNLNLVLYDEEKDYIEKILEQWEKINHYFLLNSFALNKKKIFLLKYDVDLNVIRSNKNISQIIGCSEENIRIILNKMKKEIYPLFIKNDSSIIIH